VKAEVRSGDLLLGAFRVGRSLAELGQQLVSLQLFLQIGVKERHRVYQAELAGPGLQGAVTRDLVMLDRLRRRNKAGVQSDKPLYSSMMSSPSERMPRMA